MTAAKMILHDWQRGKIPFFVPPPRQDDLSEETNVNGVDIDDAVDGNQASAAIKAIANVLSSQQQRSVPVQRDLYSENELKDETSDQLPNNGDDLLEEDLIPDSDSDMSEPDPATKVPSEELLSSVLAQKSDS
jgi:nuclear GTP-binding protein